MAALGMPKTTQVSWLCATVFPGRPHLSHAHRPVVAHAGHQHGRGLRTKLRRHTVEQYVDRGPVTVDRGSSASTATLSRGSLFTFKWRLPGAIKARPATSTSPDWASLTRMRQHGVQPLGKQFREALGHMLHHQDAAGKISRQLGEYILQCLAGRRSKRLWLRCAWAPQG